MRYIKLTYRTFLEKAPWLVTTWLMLLYISCMYLNEKMYPLKCSLSTDIINMFHTVNQFNHWFRCHNVFEIGIKCACSIYDLFHHSSSLLDTHFVLIVARNYSWLEKNGFLLPDKYLRLLAPAFLKICKSYKSCSTKRYVCQKLLRSCTICSGCSAKCKIIYNIVSKWFIFWNQLFTLCHISSTCLSPTNLSN